MKKLIAILLFAFALVSFGELSDNYQPAQFTIQNGVTDFNVGWAFFNVGNLKVTLTDPDGVDTVLEYGDGLGKYTVSAVNNDYSGGATITTGTEYEDGYQITIERVVPYEQGLEISGDFIPGDPLEQALDEIVAQIQQAQNEIGRTLTIPASDPADLSVSFPNIKARAGKITSFDSDGNLHMMSPIDSGTILSDNTTLKITNNVIHIKDSGVDSAQVANSAIKTAHIASGAVTVDELASTTGNDTNALTGVSGAHGELVGWNADGDAVGSGYGVTNDDNLGTSDTELVTQGNVKNYVDNGGGHTPSSYAGEESVTLPNGLIMKWGKTASPTGDIGGAGYELAITFSSAFPAGVINVSCTTVGADSHVSNRTVELFVYEVTTNGFILGYGERYSAVQNLDGFYWQAIGY